MLRLSTQTSRTGFLRSDILSTQQRYNLLYTNPDVLKSGDFMQLVYASSQPLSTSQIQSLQQARYTSTARTTEEAALDQAGSLKNDAITQGLAILLADTITDYAALREWWGYRNSFESGLDIADSYLAQQNTAVWQQTVTALNNGKLTAE